MGLMSRYMEIIIIIMSLFKEDNIFSARTHLHVTYGPQNHG